MNIDDDVSSHGKVHPIRVLFSHLLMHTQHTLCCEAVAFKCMSFNMCYGCVLNAGNRCACMCVECSCALCTHAIVCCGAPFYPWFCMVFCCVAMQSNAHWTRLSLCTIHLYMKRDLIYFFDSLFLLSFVNAFFILSSSSSSPLNSQCFASIMVDFCVCLISPMYFLHSTFRVNCNWYYWYDFLVHERKMFGKFFESLTFFAFLMQFLNVLSIECFLKNLLNGIGFTTNS